MAMLVIEYGYFVPSSLKLPFDTYEKKKKFGGTSVTPRLKSFTSVVLVGGHQKLIVRFKSMGLTICT